MRRIKIRTFLIFGLACLAGTALLQTSQRVQEAEEKLAALRADVAREEDTMRVLRAEWEYLNRPERLERLASKFLNLVPPVPEAMPESLIEQAATLPEKEPEPEIEQDMRPANYQQGEAP